MTNDSQPTCRCQECGRYVGPSAYNRQWGYCPDDGFVRETEALA